MMKHLMPFLDGVDVTRPEIRCNWGIVMQLKIVQIIVQSPGLDWMVDVGLTSFLGGWTTRWWMLDHHWCWMEPHRAPSLRL